MQGWASMSMRLVFQPRCSTYVTSQLQLLFSICHTSTQVEEVPERCLYQTIMKTMKIFISSFEVSSSDSAKFKILEAYSQHRYSFQLARSWTFHTGQAMMVLLSTGGVLNQLFWSYPLLADFFLHETIVYVSRMVSAVNSSLSFLQLAAHFGSRATIRK